MLVVDLDVLVQVRSHMDLELHSNHRLRIHSLTALVLLMCVFMVGLAAMSAITDI